MNLPRPPVLDELEVPEDELEAIMELELEPLVFPGLRGRPPDSLRLLCEGILAN